MAKIIIIILTTLIRAFFVLTLGMFITVKNRANKVKTWITLRMDKIEKIANLLIVLAGKKLGAAMEATLKTLLAPIKKYYTKIKKYCVHIIAKLIMHGNTQYKLVDKVSRFYDAIPLITFKKMKNLNLKNLNLKNLNLRLKKTVETVLLALTSTPLINYFNAPKGLIRILLQIRRQIERFFILSRWNKQYLIGFINSHIICYPTPICLTYAWSFGSLAGVSLIIQMISGIFLSMHYTPDINLAFSSVEFIMRDVPNGWLIRYIHANGSSMFFIVVYAHICRGLYYGSYMRPRQLLWCSGVVLLLLMMATAFTGYVLPWGQMSFWGATVITSMVTVIPIAGQDISQWLWGGYTVGNPTLKRFFAIHFCLPFLIAGFTFIHLALLHKVGSNSPIGSDVGVDDIPFFPYFFTKDAFAFACYLVVFAILVLYFPNALNHPDNYIPANPMKTPAHVVPEWYFLPYYAILRSIPHKTYGILAMLGSILVLFLIPFINTSEIRNTTFRPIFRICFWLFIADFVILTWVGQKPMKNTYIFAGQVATTYYFFFFLIIIPVVGLIESALVKFKPTQQTKSH